MQLAKCMPCVFLFFKELQNILENVVAWGVHGASWFGVPFCVLSSMVVSCWAALKGSDVPLPLVMSCGYLW